MRFHAGAYPTGRATSKWRAAGLIAAFALISASCGDTTISERAATTSVVMPPAYERIPDTSAIAACGPASGKTKFPGRLVIATDDPAFEPWFVDNNPANGQGFEGAVAAAVWRKLGFSADQVDFIRMSFEDALQPGPKPFDVDINQVTIFDKRREHVDFSAPYYAVAQSVVALAESSAAQATTVADLKSLRIGAQRNSTSLLALQQSAPEATAVEFNTNLDAKRALANRKIDAIVVDLPTGLQIAANDIPGSVLVGQFAQPNDVTEFFGLVLQKDSPYTGCATAAVNALYADGTLNRLAAEWLSQHGGAPVLR